MATITMTFPYSDQLSLQTGDVAYYVNLSAESGGFEQNSDSIVTIGTITTITNNSDLTTTTIICEIDEATEPPTTTSYIFFSKDNQVNISSLLGYYASVKFKNNSTVEAEIVSAGFAVRTVGLPSLDLWEVVLRRSVALTLIEDNESTAAIIRSGRNPTMRHLARTQGVTVSWLHYLYLKKVLGVVYSRTEAQCADVFTTTFRELPKWQQAVRLIGIAKPDAPPYVPPEPGPRPETVEKKKANGQTVATDGAAAAVLV